MFYHDHVYGTTRLNVYAGEAAPYLVTDPVEKELINGNLNTPAADRQIPFDVAPGTIPATQIPLVIQDKTFVPKFQQLVAEDPTWDVTKYGGDGQPLVPARLHAEPESVRRLGRQRHGTMGLRALVLAAVHGSCQWSRCQPAGRHNGSRSGAVPRRTQSLDGAGGLHGHAGHQRHGLPSPQGSAQGLPVPHPERQQRPVPEPTALLRRPRYKKGQRGYGTEVKMVPAVAHPGNKKWPASWPTDGRDGGVPDPKYRGPQMIQIGTEGGFLPNAGHDSEPAGQATTTTAATSSSSTSRTSRSSSAQLSEPT